MRRRGLERLSGANGLNSGEVWIWWYRRWRESGRPVAVMLFRRAFRQHAPVTRSSPVVDEPPRCSRGRPPRVASAARFRSRPSSASGGVDASPFMSASARGSMRCDIARLDHGIDDLCRGLPRQIRRALPQRLLSVPAWNSVRFTRNRANYFNSVVLSRTALLCRA